MVDDERESVGLVDLLLLSKQNDIPIIYFTNPVRTLENRFVPRGAPEILPAVMPHVLNRRYVGAALLTTVLDNMGVT